MKCIIDPSSGQPCKRCSKAGRQCIVTPPTRKRQKKADSRVAELERKIDALTATLAQREASAQNAPRPGKRPSSELDGGHAAMRKSSSYPFFGGMTEYSISPTAANGSRPNFGPDKRLRLDSEKGVGCSNSRLCAVLTELGLHRRRRSVWRKRRRSSWTSESVQSKRPDQVRSFLH